MSRRRLGGAGIGHPWAAQTGAIRAPFLSDEAPRYSVLETIGSAAVRTPSICVYQVVPECDQNFDVNNLSSIVELTVLRFLFMCTLCYHCARPEGPGA